MNQPNPAIVAQDAVRRLPRWALLLLCVAYVVPGYVGRAPWKNADISSFGYMLELAGATDLAQWLRPMLMGQVADSGALLPYWLGAWAIQLAPSWMTPDFAVRLPFIAMLAATLAGTWYAVYYLARQPNAQPVAFAFGGEANPIDYARALADGGLLALVATLGLAQFSHETTPALVQLFCVVMVFLGLAAAYYRPNRATVALMIGLPGLALSGAPATAIFYGSIVLLALLTPGLTLTEPRVRQRLIWVLLLTLSITVAMCWQLDLLRWRVAPMRSGWAEWRSTANLFLWFTWPVWPLVLWTLWRWRRQLLDLRVYRHLGLPLLLASVPVTSTLITTSGDRALLLALPSLAALAAFALPTFRRSMSALIDWFTLLFFTGWAIVIWVVWVAMQTGVPAKPAANVAKLAPGFEPVFQWPALLAALGGTLAWAALARWRTGRHRTALWKSLVLPAAGATLCWLLLMTLWLPALDYARSLAPQMREVRSVVGDAPCVQVFGLSAPQVVGVRYHGGWATEPLIGTTACPWLLVDVDAQASLPQVADMAQWELVDRVRRPTDDNETLLLLRRVGTSQK